MRGRKRRGARRNPTHCASTGSASCPVRPLQRRGPKPCRKRTQTPKLRRPLPNAAPGPPQLPSWTLPRPPERQAQPRIPKGTQPTSLAQPTHAMRSSACASIAASRTGKVADMGFVANPELRIPKQRPHTHSSVRASPPGGSSVRARLPGPRWLKPASPPVEPLPALRCLQAGARGERRAAALPCPLLHGRAGGGAGAVPRRRHARRPVASSLRALWRRGTGTLGRCGAEPHAQAQQVGSP